MPQRFVRIALVLAAPLLVAGCGVKGPLEPPPYAKAQFEEQRRETAQPLNPFQQRANKEDRSLPQSQAGTGAGTQSSPVMNAPAARERSVLDFLIN